MAFNVKKFVNDLISGAAAEETIPAMAFGKVLITALCNQLDPAAVKEVTELTRGQKAARTRKRNKEAAARKANSGAHTGDQVPA